jgi:hypothetical protein
VLEEDDTLATEAAGEEDQNSTGLKAFPELGGTNSLANLFKRTIMSETLVRINPDTLASHGYVDISPEMRFSLSIHVHIDTGLDPPTKAVSLTGAIVAFIHK